MGYLLTNCARNCALTVVFKYKNATLSFMYFLKVLKTALIFCTLQNVYHIVY